VPGGVPSIGIEERLFLAERVSLLSGPRDEVRVIGMSSSRVSMTPDSLRALGAGEEEREMGRRKAACLIAFIVRKLEIEAEW